LCDGAPLPPNLQNGWAPWHCVALAQPKRVDRDRPQAGRFHSGMIRKKFDDARIELFAYGENVPLGEGDAPVKEVLLLMKKNRYPIPAMIEYEYSGADTIAEVRRFIPRAVIWPDRSGPPGREEASLQESPLRPARLAE
jgi:hypothetical protein